MFVTLWDVMDFLSRTLSRECYHFTTFFQDDVIGQCQPSAKYDRQLSSVAQDTAARSVPTTSKSGDKVSTDMHYRLAYSRNQ